MSESSANINEEEKRLSSPTLKIGLACLAALGFTTVAALAIRESRLAMRQENTLSSSITSLKEVSFFRKDEDGVYTKKTDRFSLSRDDDEGLNRLTTLRNTGPTCETDAMRYILHLSHPNSTY